MSRGERLSAWLCALLAAVLLALPATADARCRTHKCWYKVHVKRANHWLREHRPWVWAWRHEPAYWQNWLRATAQCESGNRAHIATGNGFYGLTQFNLATWAEAGGTGYPHHASWHEQAVRSIELAQRVGTGRWPVCG